MSRRGRNRTTAANTDNVSELSATTPDLPPTPIQQQPVSAESGSSASAGPEGKSGETGTGLEVQPPAAAGAAIAPPRVWTEEEVFQEYFPGKKKCAGGVAAGIRRETRRRNRLAEKGY